MHSPADIKVARLTCNQARRSSESPYVTVAPIATGRPDDPPSWLYLLLDFSHENDLFEHFADDLIEIIYEALEFSHELVTISMEKALRRANSALYVRNRHLPPDERLYVGATLAIVDDVDVYISQAGPALAYVIQGGRLSQFPPELPPAGDRKLEHARALASYPLGVEASIPVDLYHVELDGDAVVTLATPSLAMLASPDSLHAILDQDPKAAIRALARLAYRTPLSAIVIQYRPPTTMLASRISVSRSRYPEERSTQEPISSAPVSAATQVVQSTQRAIAQLALSLLPTSGSAGGEALRPDPSPRHEAHVDEEPDDYFRGGVSGASSVEPKVYRRHGTERAERRTFEEQRSNSARSTRTVSASGPPPGLPRRNLAAMPIPGLLRPILWVSLAVLILLIAPYLVNRTLSVKTTLVETPVDTRAGASDARSYKMVLDQDLQFKALLDQSQQRQVESPPRPANAAGSDTSVGLSAATPSATGRPGTQNTLLVAGVITFTVQGDGPFYAYGSPSVLDNFTQSDLHLHFMNGRYVFYVGSTPPSPVLPRTSANSAGLSPATPTVTPTPIRTVGPTPTPPLTLPDAPNRRLRNLGAIPYADVVLAPQPPNDYQELQEVKDGHVYVIFTPDGTYAKFQAVAVDLPYPRDRPGHLLLKWIYQPNQQRTFR